MSEQSRQGTEQINPDVFDYDNGMSQCISGAGRNAKDALDDALEHGAVEDIQRVHWFIDEFVRWCQGLNKAAQEKQAVIDRLWHDSTGAKRIALERVRQQVQEGWTAQHDDGHEYKELASNALAVLAQYATGHPDVVELEDDWGLATTHRHEPMRLLEIAGALIAAELDRLNRATPDRRKA